MRMSKSRRVAPAQLIRPRQDPPRGEICRLVRQSQGRGEFFQSFREVASELEECDSTEGRF